MRISPLKTSSNASAMTADNTFCTSGVYRAMSNSPEGMVRAEESVIQRAAPFLNLKYLSEVEESLMKMEEKKSK